MRAHGLVLRKYVGKGIGALLLVALASSAQAQELAWRMRIGAGALVPVDRSAQLDATTDVTVRSSVVTVMDAIAATKCCVELFASGLIVPVMDVDVSVDGTSHSAGTIMPSGVQAGLRYRWWRGDKSSLWGGVLVGGFARRKTDVVDGGLAPGRALSLSGGWGVGAEVSYRRRLSSAVSVDTSVRWQTMQVTVGENGQFGWNPFVVSGGLVARLGNRD